MATPTPKPEKTLVNETTTTENRFSDVLSSRVVEVAVSTDEKKKTFFIHEELLCRASSKMRFQLRGPFKEAQTGKIPDCEEDPALFAFFGEYVYRDGWLADDTRAINHASEYVLLARLYAMGERLMAERFQKACLWKFGRDFSLRTEIADAEICQLLEVTTEIPEDVVADDLRALVLWYAASKLSRLRKYSDFRHLLARYPDLGRQILMWAADNTGTEKPVDVENKKPEGGFVDEVEFY